MSAFQPAGGSKAPASAFSAKKYAFPPMDLLLKQDALVSEETRAEAGQGLRLFEKTLKESRVDFSEIGYVCGPTVTRYEFTPAASVRAKALSDLAVNLALAFGVSNVRMVQVPGKSAVGAEVANKASNPVRLRSVLESGRLANESSATAVALGVNVAGEPVAFDLAEMPHLLVSGAVNMGKSVCINAMVTGLLFRASPEDLKLLLIDPKAVELAPYEGIPHLLAPVVTSATDAAVALQAATLEMESRFELLLKAGAKNLQTYREIAKRDPNLPRMPYLVVVIDDLADLMLPARGRIEEPLCRLLQKGRACGIHLILGTQRPSVDVVTGLIKANIPSRIALTVASQIDSRNVLGVGGAEKLIGRGDLLFLPVGATCPERVQCALVLQDEVARVCSFLRSQNGGADHDEKFIQKMKELSAKADK